MPLTKILLLTTAFFYGLAFFANAYAFIGTKGSRAAFACMRVGFLIATFHLAAEAMEHGFFLPVTDLSQALSFFAWSLAFVYLVLLVRIQSDSFGLILNPVLFLLVAGSAATVSMSPASEDLKSLLGNPYFALHILSAFFAYASFTISFAAGVLYLIQYKEIKSKNLGRFFHKLPSLEELEKLIYKPLLWGAPLLGFALIIGFAWAQSAYGRFWLSDPKTIATLITVFLYLALLGLRGMASIHGRQVALLSLIAFAFVVFSFVGTRFIRGGVHNSGAYSVQQGNHL